MPSISAAARPTFARGGIGPPDYASLPRGPTKRCKNLSECRFRCRAGDRIGHGQTGGGGPFILAQEKDGKIRYCGFPSSPPPSHFGSVCPRTILMPRIGRGVKRRFFFVVSAAKKEKAAQREFVCFGKAVFLPLCRVKQQVQH